MTTTDNGGLRELALFAGAGGGILGGLLLGWRTVCAVEWDAYAASILVARQNDGTLAPFPIWDDVQTFDGRPWRGAVDVVSGGFPCTDISAAGKGAGIDGEASGMWRHMARIIGEVRPRHVFVENSPLLVRRGLARVLGDLAAMGYDARWGIIGAADVGAPHQRDRIWIVADASGEGWQFNQHSGASGRGQTCGSIGESRQIDRDEVVGDANIKGLEGTHDHAKPSKWVQHESMQSSNEVADARSIRQPRQGESWYSSDPAETAEGETDYAFHERVGHIWGAKSPVGRVADGVAHRVDRLRCIGNGQVPRVAALAWEVMR